MCYVWVVLVTRSMSYSLRALCRTTEGDSESGNHTRHANTDRDVSNPISGRTVATSGTGGALCSYFQAEHRLPSQQRRNVDSVAFDTPNGNMPVTGGDRPI